MIRTTLRNKIANIDTEFGTKKDRLESIKKHKNKGKERNKHV